MTDSDNFNRWCADHGIELLQHQRAFIEAMLAYPPARTFLSGGLGSGRTFAAETLERYFNEQRLGSCMKTTHDPKFLMYCLCGFAYRAATAQRCLRCDSTPLRVPDNFDPLTAFGGRGEPRVSCVNCGPQMQCARCDAIQQLVRRL